MSGGPAAERFLGHQRAESLFLRRWKCGRVAHAWLISGPEGIGKATFARRIARFVLAAGGDAAADSLAIPPDHPVGRRVTSGGHADLMVLSRGAGTGEEGVRRVIGVDEVRGAGRFLALTPGEAGWRVVIVDSADELNANAANALLKMLEEPPSNTLILLVSHVPGRLPATLRSRCCRLALSPLPQAVLRELLEAQLPEAGAGERETLAALAEGSIGRAVALADAGGPELFRKLVGFAGSLPEIDLPALHEFAERLARRDAEAAWRTTMWLWARWLARIAGAAARASSGPAGTESVAGEGEAARMLTARLGVERLAALWEKTVAQTAQAEGLNLDRKQVVIGAFHQLQSAYRG